MNEKHFFAGANTSHGFYSNFEYLITPHGANHIYLLKGGPGVGKSSFMKKFASTMLTKGYFIEFIHCSSDNQSLDGIIIPDLSLTFLDATAPHTIEPQIPGAVDEIINLGAFLDNNLLFQHKVQIVELNKKKTNLYKSAYRMLECCGLILEDINSIYDHFTHEDKFTVLCNDTITNIFPEPFSLSNTYGNARRLFAESYTANGYISYTDSLCEGKKVWCLIGKNTNSSSKLLDFIITEGLRRGYNMEVYCQPLNPNKIQHLFIPHLNLFIKSQANEQDKSYEKSIYMSDLMDLEQLNKNSELINKNMVLFDQLMDIALDKLSCTKQEHEILESLYINSMNFDLVNKLLDSLLAKYS